MKQRNKKGKSMDNRKFIDLCKGFVADYCNNKTLLSTTVSDGMYYEITYNGDKDEYYFDAYKKWENICFVV